jgi:ABC-2 type transport system permease protein
MIALQTLTAILRKDLLLYFSNRFFAFVTVLGLVFYLAIWFVMPGHVDETVQMALYAPALPPALAEQLGAGDEGVSLVLYESAETLRDAIAAGIHPVGIALPDNFAIALAGGQPVTARAWFGPGFPQELRGLYDTFVQEMGYLLAGQPLNVQITEELVGADRAGNQIPWRERMVPLFAVLLLVTEMMGLASLIAGELAGGTLTALLVTPLRVRELFLAKGLFGTGLAFSQATLLMAVTGGLAQQPAIILLALLFGSVLVTGIAFLVASVGRDLLSVMGWSMLGMILMTLPAFAVLMPELVSTWVRAIPSWYLVNTVWQVTWYDWGWREAAPQLLILALWAGAFLTAGIAVLQRRFQ